MVPYYVITTVLKGGTSKDIYLEKQSWIPRWLDPACSETIDPLADCARSLRKILLASVQFSAPSIYLEQTKTHTYLEISPQSMHLALFQGTCCWLRCRSIPLCSSCLLPCVVSGCSQCGGGNKYSPPLNCCHQHLPSVELASALYIFFPKWKTNQTPWLKLVFF